MVGIFVFDVAHAGIEELVAEAQASPKDDTLAMNEIIQRFEGLTIRLAGSIRGAENVRDDLANAARIGLVQAVRHHDPKRGSFPGLAKVYMRGAVLREHARWMVPETAVADITESSTTRTLGRDPANEVNDRLAPWGGSLVATAIAGLSADQRTIAELRYIEDAPIKDIAASVGTSGAAVSQRLGTIHRRVADEVDI
jgi:RNA polymerase sigma factor (sigma-70 family)